MEIYLLRALPEVQISALRHPKNTQKCYGFSVLSDYFINYCYFFDGNILINNYLKKLIYNILINTNTYLSKTKKYWLKLHLKLNQLVSIALTKKFSASINLILFFTLVNCWNFFFLKRRCKVHGFLLHIVCTAIIPLYKMQ